jgi:anti-sigma factor RsiW
MPDEHRRLRMSLGAYVLGGMSAAEAAAVERHLARCVDCSADADDLIEALFALILLPEQEGRGPADE